MWRIKVVYKMAHCNMHKVVLHAITILHIGLLVPIRCENEVTVECAPLDDGTYYPHPNCSKYYRCTSGQLYELDCSPGTYWNPATDECDHPYNVPECEGGTRPPVGTSSTTTPNTSTRSTTITNTEDPQPTTGTSQTSTRLTTTSTTSGTTTRITSTTASYSTTGMTTTTTPAPTTIKDSITPLPNGCPIEGVDKIPYPGSCVLYMICIDGQPHVTNCSDGLFFNPDIKECDQPEIVNCTETLNNDSWEGQASASNPTYLRLACPNNNSSSIFVRHPISCSKYYLCKNGMVQNVFSCSNNYWFDFALQTCQIPWHNTCQVEHFM